MAAVLDNAQEKKKKKIAILGGGMAGLSTAFHLTEQPGWKDNYEITIYQMGWRLGGKCATGRGPDGRIEEHGIHLFGGGYYNALDMMHKCYAEITKPDFRDGPWPVNFEQAFERQSYNAVWVGEGDSRKRVDVELPDNTLKPTDGVLFGSNFQLLAAALETLRKQLRQHDDFNEDMKAMLGGVRAVRSAPSLGLSTLTRLAISVTQAGQTIIDRLSSRRVPDLYESGQSLLNQVIDDIRNAAHLSGDALRHAASALLAKGQAWRSQWLLDDTRLAQLEAEFRATYHLLDYLTAIVHGAFTDLLRNNGNFAALDDREWSDWLRSHGASQSTVDSWIALAPLRILYAYRDPAAGNRPSMGAGTYLHWVLRTFAYLGSPFWFFSYGTGETLIAPLYTALKARGVKFAFFHKVTDVVPDSTGSGIEEIHIDIQAEPASEVGYDPLVQASYGTPALPVWPNEPIYGRLKCGDKVKREGGDLESYWNNYKYEQRTRTLKRDTDFDRVVFAISLGAIPIVCSKLMAQSQPWRDMVDHLPTVETASLQVWLNRSTKDLGGHTKKAANHPDDTFLTCGFASPFDGVVDFSPLIAREGWDPSTRPGALWYFSDTIPQTKPAVDLLRDTNYPGNRNAYVRQVSIDFLEKNIPILLPGSGKPGGTTFNFNELFVRSTPGVSSDGKARIDEQFWRANVEPSERYVTAPAKTTQYRLAPNQSGYVNLVLAGDWTRTGLNVGCVEATVMSGKLASYAISRFPALNDIIGYQP